MLLSHEMGQEMSCEEVLKKAKRLIRYLRKEEGVKKADIDYALHYWQELLEKKYYGG